ncbi:hypothetical protein [Salinimicrobium terrae]|uniref:hypothetical protein n=1 Tax=Salinimicrobium terrae TaxID=470866 RepID=UPI00040C80E1|nr:hypothetical protein [Salinimicrobium terrae]
MKYLRLRITSIVYVLLFAFLLSACENDAQEIDLKQNEVQRSAVYDQILDDEELFTEFINRMHQNDQAVNLMVSHRDMMQQMYNQEHMEMMMQEHPNMMGAMMQHMMSAMQQDNTMMRQNPQIRQQMMQNMMNMMDQDSVMYNEMEQRMQHHHMGGPDRMN